MICFRSSLPVQASSPQLSSCEKKWRANFNLTCRQTSSSVRSSMRDLSFFFAGNDSIWFFFLFRGDGKIPFSVISLEPVFVVHETNCSENRQSNKVEENYKCWWYIGFAFLKKEKTLKKHLKSVLCFFGFSEGQNWLDLICKKWENTIVTNYLSKST